MLLAVLALPLIATSVLGAMGVRDASDQLVLGAYRYVRVRPAFGEGTPEPGAMPPTSGSYGFVELATTKGDVYREVAGTPIPLPAGSRAYSVGACERDYRLALVQPAQPPLYYEADWAQSVAFLADRHPLDAVVNRIQIGRIIDGKMWYAEISDRATIESLVALAREAPYEPERLGGGPLSCDPEGGQPYFVVFCADRCLSDATVSEQWFPVANVFVDGFAPLPAFGKLVVREFRRAEPFEEPVPDGAAPATEWPRIGRIERTGSLAARLPMSPNTWRRIRIPENGSARGSVLKPGVATVPGNIVEQGRHEELLARDGFYAELYNSQFAGAAVAGREMGAAPAGAVARCG